MRDRPIGYNRSLPPPPSSSSLPRRTPALRACFRLTPPLLHLSPTGDSAPRRDQITSSSADIQVTLASMYFTQPEGKPFT
ncbi:hypothetical protein GUJ93_ZPchr0014g47105 [Zizania palustris]|uniref:Uncharacterized protein n=1 Tax=Zizania palustris TaxID=103762 RepID=A0A8J5W6Y5_ZIZPA|nr:hypothetical protein GUJ93_ZPchr0014g47105 [Zizania palustris]